MTTVRFRAIARAPSNIAIIKYMGKKDAGLNIPANPSISMTLSGLCTVTEATIERSSHNNISWICEKPHTDNLNNLNLLNPPALTDEGAARIIRHVELIKKETPGIFAHLGISTDDSFISTPHTITLRSANTFPMASGIASSASSFAAITLATIGVLLGPNNQNTFARAWEQEAELRRLVAALSRQGSGSSCRSFNGPWVMWDSERTTAIPTNLPELSDLVLLISNKAKDVSSTEAHKRVQTSPLWSGRQERAQGRVETMLSALEAADLRQISTLAWAELWEMHSLFHTSTEPFTYWEPETIFALKWLGQFIGAPTSPIVTMDAGANIHVIIPTIEREKWLARLATEFTSLPILSDCAGLGAKLEMIT